MCIRDKCVVGGLIIGLALTIIVLVLGSNSHKLHIPGVVTTENYTDPSMVIDGMDPQQDLVYITIAVRDRALFEEVRSITQEISKERLKRK